MRYKYSLLPKPRLNNSEKEMNATPASAFLLLMTQDTPPTNENCFRHIFSVDKWTLWREVVCTHDSFALDNNAFMIAALPPLHDMNHSFSSKSLIRPDRLIPCSYWEATRF